MLVLDQASGSELDRGTQEHLRGRSSRAGGLAREGICGMSGW